MIPARIYRSRRVLPAVVCGLIWVAASGCYARPESQQPARETPPTRTTAAASISGPSATPIPSASPELSPEPATQTPRPAESAAQQPSLYISQPGDTFRAVAARFWAKPLDLRCLSPVRYVCPQTETGRETSTRFDPDRLLPIGTSLIVPPALDVQRPAIKVLPDSEVVFSKTASDFDIAGYLQTAGGHLAEHKQYLMMNAWNSAAEIIALVAEENSINPRLLLALLEYRCDCVHGKSASPEPYLGVDFILRSDLYGQLVWAAHELSIGYYGWREGTFTQVILRDDSVVRLNPRLNAGSAALYRIFSQLNDREGFIEALDPEVGFPAVYSAMFGDPWSRELVMIPDGVVQPPLRLPFEDGHAWSYTGGPHPAFEGNGPLAALDFAPASAEPGCQPTEAWVVAAASGLVVRSEHGSLVQDLDGDGDENTGWVLLYLHVADSGRAKAGERLEVGDRIGQPSCEGGITNGTHVHIARKLNGEWIPAGSGPLPFNLDGWVASDGPLPYKGTLSRNGTVLTACACSWRAAWFPDE